jgi:hypothetical protein
MFSSTGVTVGIRSGIFKGGFDSEQVSEFGGWQSMQNHLARAFLSKSKVGSAASTHLMWKKVPDRHLFLRLQEIIPVLEHRLPFCSETGIY